MTGRTSPHVAPPQVGVPKTVFGAWCLGASSTPLVQPEVAEIVAARRVVVQAVRGWGVLLAPERFGDLELLADAVFRRRPGFPRTVQPNRATSAGAKR